ncbi:MAG TPA: hypothetical protein VIW25_13690, partial [Nitrososphaeraceae archaeon]
DRVDDFARILKKTEQPIQRLNEELGIAVPAVQQSSYNRYQKGRSYWYNKSSGGHRSHSRYGDNRSRGHGGYGGRIRNTRSYREQRSDNRNNRYGRESSRS